MPAVGVIDWNDDLFLYRYIALSMGILSDLLYGLVDKLCEGLLGLTYTAVLEELPSIEWGRARDDYSNDQVGYSFFTDIRN